MNLHRPFPWFAVLLVLFAPSSAQAYLDAGTGSVVLQLLLGGVAGLLMFVKLYWHRTLAFFGRKKPDAEAESSTESHPTGST